MGENALTAVKEKNIKDYLMENDELIYKTKYLVGQFKEELLGRTNSEQSENPSPVCMLHLLEIENYNLREIVSELEEIQKTLKPNN